MSEAASGRDRIAKVSALRQMCKRRRRLAIPPCPPDWHPQRGTEWEEVDRVYLAEHPEVRERMGRNFHRQGASTPRGV
jgi:hypothetical protein